MNTSTTTKNKTRNIKINTKTSKNNNNEPYKKQAHVGEEKQKKHQQQPINLKKTPRRTQQPKTNKY